MKERPNILVFLTDDHGQWASQPYGNSEIVSPTMQWLGSEGVRFTHAFTPCPVCSPARASFWTGRIPSAHGVHDFLQEPGDNAHPGIAGQLNLAQQLKTSGYRTGLVGKWHCGRFWKPHEGFDTWFTSALGTNARFGKQQYYEGDELKEYHGHQAPVLTERALQFLRDEGDRPWFLFVGYTDTHTPHSSAPPRLTSRYTGASFSDIPDEEVQPSVGYSKMRFSKERREELADYYASVQYIDEQMGRIVDELQSRGELENTIIVYTSDHGHMNGHHGLHSKGNASIPQNFLEESIHVPLIVRDPGTRSGATSAAFVDHCDLYATLLDAGGVDPETAAGEAPSPGRSFLPVLRGEKDFVAKPIQFCEYGNARMARDERYKLILRFPGPNGHFRDELYDLQEDPRETRNLLDDPSLRAAQETLQSALEHFFGRYELPRYAGKRVGSLPRHNPKEPWRATSQEEVQ